MYTHAFETDLAHGFDDACAEAIWGIERSVRLAEDQVVGLVVGAIQLAVARLRNLMLLQNLQRPFGNRESPGLS